MPISQLFFVLGCLMVTLLLRSLLRPVISIPTVFLYLLLGIGLGVLARSGYGQNNLAVLNSNATQQPIALIGWLGILLFMAFGTSGIEKSDRHSDVSWIAVVKISVIGFGGTFLCATALGHIIGIVEPNLKGPLSNSLSFAMAIGLACSVTALPVLAALLYERGDHTTTIGKLAIRVAVLDDIWMWLILIVVVGLTGSQVNPWVYSLKVAAFLSCAWFILQPALALIHQRFVKSSQTNCMILGLSLVVGMAILSEKIGIHGLLGAFVVGWVLPAAMMNILRTLLLPMVQGVLVPFFFIMTGMRTDISLTAGNFLMLAFGFIAISIALKITFVSLGARYAGVRWAQAFRAGALLQCKGLMEIVILGLMRDSGIIGPEVFSALLVMALACTILTVPLYSFMGRFDRERRDDRMILTRTQAELDGFESALLYSKSNFK